MLRESLERRWQAIASDLKEMSAHRIVPVRQAMADRRCALLEEQDAIEYELRMLDFAERDCEKNSGTQPFSLTLPRNAITTKRRVVGEKCVDPSLSRFDKPIP
jgi:hypothetical protein